MTSAKKKGAEDELKLLKSKLVKKDKTVIGTKTVLKELKAKTLSKVFLASNCLPKIKADLSYYAELAGVPIVELEMGNEELGVLCKRNYFVAVIGIKD